MTERDFAVSVVEQLQAAGHEALWAGGCGSIGPANGDGPLASTDMAVLPGSDLTQAPTADDTAQFKVLGEAHRASSMVVFQGTINSLSGGIGQPSAETVESTVVAHEFGHVLGLVNISTPMVQNHEDAQHPKHDVNDKCLMYYANNSNAGLANLLGGGAIVDFDANCRADMLAVRNAK